MTAISSAQIIDLEAYFESFRTQIIGTNEFFETPYGKKKLIYTDWTASGRLYRPIERVFLEEISPFVGNTHTETTITGSLMTQAYHEAKEIIKNHVGAKETDILVTAGSGMTGAINKLQRILGFKIHEKWIGGIKIKEASRPVVFVSHMEHHSNHTSWLETIADVEIIKPNDQGLIDLNHLQKLCDQYKTRKTKIASVIACSNVTGIETPYHQIAKIMHEHDGLCFVDFACSGPYVDINMHPKDPMETLDAIFLSPHKFLGGPGTPGVVVFQEYLYNNNIPDNPGGGTVCWTDPWGDHHYVEKIEDREDGGTPAFLQTIKAAMAVRLKEKMGTENIRAREEELLEIIWNRLHPIPNLHVLASQHKKRLGVVSFYIDDLHFNLVARILNDRFGIQVRGGCSCAGTYGHFLLNIDEETSGDYKKKVLSGDDWLDKPGWVRLSIHPTMTNKEIHFCLDAIEQLCDNHETWSKDYMYVQKENEYVHHLEAARGIHPKVKKWLD